MDKKNDSFIDGEKIVEEKEKTTKFKNVIIIAASIVMLLFVVDFASVMLFKKEPIIVVAKQEDKYSSVLYDVYFCEDGPVVKFKTEKYSCVDAENQKTDSTDNQDTSHTTHSSTADNQNSLDNNSDNDSSNNKTDTDSQSTNAGNADGTDDSSLIDKNDKHQPESNQGTSTNVDKGKDNNVSVGEVKGNIRIVDKSSGNCAQAIDYYYEDANYKYYFTCIKSNSIYVIKNGQEYTIKYALNYGIVTMDELIQAGFKPLKQSKNLVDK